MSTDYGQIRGTCQWCRKKQRTRRTGSVFRHRVPGGGNWCPGGSCLSVEAAAEVAALPPQCPATVEAHGGLVRCQRRVAHSGTHHGVGCESWSTEEGE